LSDEQPKEKVKRTRYGSKIVEGRIVSRKNVVVPPEEVYKLAQIGCKNHEICEWFDIDENTLTYNFRPELDRGRNNLKQSLRQAQLRLALQGNAVMLIWLGKNILGQSDNPINSDANEPLPWSE
jgi:hypothetical protein